jgi:hypothetical protein
MTSREVDILLHRIEKLHEEVQGINATLAQINGRLRKVELWRAGMEAVDRAHSWIRPAVVSFVSGAAVTAIGWILSTL